MASLAAPALSAAGYRGLPPLFRRTQGVAVKPASAPRPGEPSAPISEKDWARVVVEYAELMGWKVYHTWRSDHSPAGFPDLVLARERVIFVELKSDRGRLTWPQQQWVEALRAAKQEMYVWYPIDWDEVQRVLGR